MSPVVSQLFVQAQIKENIKAPRHWPLWGNSPVTGEFPAQKASNADNFSLSWRHHVKALPCYDFTMLQQWILSWLQL